MPDRNERASRAIAQLQQAVEKLKTRASLELRNVAFCQRINGFGSYENFPADQFSRGQPVAVYAEVANFTSRAGPAGQGFETALQSTIEIYTPGPGAQLVDRVVLPVTREQTRTARRDYFLSYDFRIPPTLPLGPHTLKLTIEDLQSQKIASTHLNFTVR